MKLYRPVLIESAEQAEALPEGTVAIGTRYGVIEKGSRGRWWAGLAELPDRIAVGGTALVPIEAEEETVERHRLCREVPDVLHRFTTPWTLYTAKETP